MIHLIRSGADSCTEPCDSMLPDHRFSAGCGSVWMSRMNEEGNGRVRPFPCSHDGKVRHELKSQGYFFFFVSSSSLTLVSISAYMAESFLRSSLTASRPWASWVPL